MHIFGVYCINRIESTSCSYCLTHLRAPAYLAFFYPTVLLTGHFHRGPFQASWWLYTPAYVHPSMQSDRSDHSSGQTYTGHSGAAEPGDGNSCGTPEWQNWEGNTKHRMQLGYPTVYFFCHQQNCNCRGRGEVAKNKWTRRPMTRGCSKQTYSLAFTVLYMFS